MPRTTNDSFKIALGAVALMAAILWPTPAPAAAGYGEGFDNVGGVSGGQHGPSALIAAGWTFRNQSSPSGSGY